MDTSEHKNTGDSESSARDSEIWISRARSYSLNGETSERSSSYLGQSTPSGSTSSQNSFDEQRVLAKNGVRVLSSMSDLVTVLAKSGIQGPRDLKSLNLESRAVKIGEGAQFNVFKENPYIAGPALRGYSGLEGLVVKRVAVTTFWEPGQDLVEGRNYRYHMRSIELEINALCHSSIRNHRNITTLLAWGRDYLDRQTPVPVLFMEAAECSLSTFLASKTSWEVKYHLALDIASGLQLLQKFNIVHGDMKPDNVLIFKQDDPKVPFVAKLSDFGLCIDLSNSKSELTIDDYYGTPGFNAPELWEKDLFEQTTGTPFEPIMMLKFDAYSYGLVLVSLFCTEARLRTKKETRTTIAETAVSLVKDRAELPSSLKFKLYSGLRSFLDNNPTNRLLPSPELLIVDDLTPYHDWRISSMIPTKTHREGQKDPRYNMGPAFWANLDKNILRDLVESALSEKPGNPSKTPAEMLFGLSIGLSHHLGSEYVDKVLDCVERAAYGTYPPAQAICAQMLRAHKKPLPLLSVLKCWEKNSIETGYFFKAMSSDLSFEEIEEAKDCFRRNGGYCIDDFMSNPSILEIAANPRSVEDWISKHGPDTKVDLDGNLLTHVVAALGITPSMNVILKRFPNQIDARNDNGETVLYKACQAGHINILRLIREAGGTLTSTATLKEQITPLHWLFMFKEKDIAEVCAYLIDLDKKNINAQMVPEATNSITFQSGFFPLFHYPFELPYGTPLHWASATRNLVAMEMLLQNDASVDATCFECESHSSPLALAVHFGDTEVASLLLRHGANPKVVDSRRRTLLHLMSEMLPRVYGVYSLQWHYWIRHGPWENHLWHLSRMVNTLVSLGADTEATTTMYRSFTPLLMASNLGVHNGGVIAALITAGADVNDGKGGCGDSVLQSWSSVAAERLYYPDCYSKVMNMIIEGTKDVGYANDLKQTALHRIADARPSRGQFASSVTALLSKDPPPDIDAVDRDGDTPLLITLMGNLDAMYQAEMLLDFGANIYSVNKDGKNVFGVITANRSFMDEDSLNYIRMLLLRLNNKSKKLVFKDFEYSSNVALWNASMYARPKTLKLLLDLGMSAHINDIYTIDAERTALDLALDYGEASRIAYMENCARYGLQPETKDVEDSNKCYDERQGGAARAREAYWAFPSVIDILLKYGAKRAWQLGPKYNSGNIEQPEYFDLHNIYGTGFSPATQPHRKHWDLLYELAKYPLDWTEKHLDACLLYYEQGTYRPGLTLLKKWPRLCQKLQELSTQGWIEAVSDEGLLIKVKMKEGEVVETRMQLNRSQ